jgi:DegV family protein with EDD domain
VVAIVADSAANLPVEMARELRIQIVPMYLKFGDRVYRDGLDMTPADFYERLVVDEVAASTSTPSPGDFLEAFEATGDPEIVCVTVTSGMSASFRQASFAAERFEGRVEVIDSKSASVAEGFVALAAGRAAHEGATLVVAAALARAVADRTTLVATVDTFEYLRRSGRVKKFQAYAATMLDIKPVFRFHLGEVVPVARPRTRKRALTRIVEEARTGIAGRPAHLAVFHAAAAEEAEEVAERITADANVLERFLVEATPVIGAHTGPGLLGAGFYTD